MSLCTCMSMAGCVQTHDGNEPCRAGYKLAELLPEGEHPRLFFNRKQLPEIRSRARTPLGEKLLAELRAKRGDIAKLESQDQQWLEQAKADSIKGYTAFAGQCYSAALLYQMTGAKKDGDIAASLFRIWLSASVDDPLKQWAPDYADYAMAYDWIYELLTPSERDQARKIFITMLGQPADEMFQNEAHLEASCLSGRKSSNWSANFPAIVGLTALAIENEEGYSPEILQRSIAVLDKFLVDGFTPGGAMFDGSQYATGYGTLWATLFLHALDRRGVDLYSKSNVKEMPLWLIYDILPWGHELFDYNQSVGNISSGSRILSMISVRDPKYGRWVFDQFCMPELKVSNGLLPDPLIALTSEIPNMNATAMDRNEFPLSHWFSVAGLVYCRSGWKERDTVCLFNTMPLGCFHSHNDHGTFSIVSNGAYLICDSGVNAFSSKDHNIVHIDGKAIGAEQGRAESYIRSVDFSGYADLIDADLKSAYSRKLDGEANGPWQWDAYNPVIKADRRLLFVRGASGPLIIVSDDIKKDSQDREYDWQANVLVNNVLEVAGSNFTVKERFGGKFLRAADKGQTAVLEATDVANGVYHGWALVRNEPSLATWSINSVKVNGQKTADNLYFGRGFYRNGWHWLPIADKTGTWNFSTGKLRIELESFHGGRVAAFVFASDLNWLPGDDVPKNGNGFVVLGVDSLARTSDSWEISESPKGMLDGIFLGEKSPELKIGQGYSNNLTAGRNKIIHAVQKLSDGKFLAVMSPHDEGDGRKLISPLFGSKQIAAVTIGNGTDIVCGAVDNKIDTDLLKTDAKAAVMSFPKGLEHQDVPEKYIVADGGKLSYKNNFMVESDSNVNVINDGVTLTVRGQGGTKVKCRRLGATKLVCNGKPMPLTLQDVVPVEIPKLPSQWEIRISSDGTVVDASGDGTIPLMLSAPDAREVLVNGVSRYFLRPDHNTVYVPLEDGTNLFKSPGTYEASELLENLDVPESASIIRSEDLSKDFPGEDLLKVQGGKLKFKIPLDAPMVFDIKISCFAADRTDITVAANDQVRADIQIPEKSNSFVNAELQNIKAPSGEALIELESQKSFAVGRIVVIPQYYPIAEDSWSVLGPFPSQGDAVVKEGLEKPFISEDGKIDLKGVYPLPGGDTLRWLQMAKTGNQSLRFSSFFKFPKFNVCYAVTFINAPESRKAKIKISCDYYSRAFLNGQRLTSDRSPLGIAKTGADFQSGTSYFANVSLRKGINTLLVKCHGGSGGNSITVGITDPGDLTFSPE